MVLLLLDATGERRKKEKEQRAAGFSRDYFGRIHSGRADNLLSPTNKPLPWFVWFAFSSTDLHYF